MGDKPYNKALFKDGMKIVKDNRQLQQNAYDAQAKAQMWGQVGNAITGVTGAFLQRHELDKKQAAQDALGTQLGLDSGIARQLDPASMATLMLQQKNRGYVSPEDQSKIDMNKAQQDWYAARSEAERFDMSEAGLRAKHRMSGGGSNDYTQAHIALGKTPEMAAALRGIAPPASAAYPNSSQSVDEQFSFAVDPNSEFAKYLKDRGIQYGPRGRGTIDPQLYNNLTTQFELNNRASGKSEDLIAANQLKKEIEVLRQSGKDNALLQEKELAFANIMANLNRVYGSNADTLGFIDEHGNYDQSRARGAAQGDAQSIVSALQSLINNGGAAPVAPTVAPQAPVAPEATTTLKPLSSEHIQRYNAASPEQKAQMKSAAQARGYDVSGLN